MLKRNRRISIAVASAVLSLPALFAVFAGSVLVYETAVLSGYRDNPLHAVLKLLSSGRGLLFLILALLFVGYVAVFSYLLVRFARGLALPLLARIYCMTIVILVIGEKIRLQVVDGNAWVWFGAFSLPHVVCLFVIIWISAKWLRPGVPYRGQSEFG